MRGAVGHLCPRSSKRAWTANTSASMMRRCGTDVTCQLDSGLMRETRLQFSGPYGCSPCSRRDGHHKKRVRQQTGAAFAVANNGRGTPEIATRSGYALAVEVDRDGTRRPAGEIFGEDASHDGGFRFDDGRLPRSPGTGA